MRKNRDKTIPIVFTSEDEAVKAIYSDNISQTIFVFPRMDKSNDYKSYAKFILRLDDQLVVSELMYAAVAIKDRAEQKRSNIIKKNTPGYMFLVSKKNTESDRYIGLGSFDADTFKVVEFFTLLEDMAAYRRLVYSAGSRGARRILYSLNDLVEIKLSPNKKELINHATSSDIFHFSFMRNSEAFFAYHNAQDILRGLKFEHFDYISKDLKLTFKLDGFSNTHDINFLFNTNTIIPGRINILIGENGLGKSQTLNHFVRSALRRPGYVDNLIAFNEPNQRPMISRLLVISTPGETQNTYPRQSSANSKLYYKKLSLNKNSSNVDTVCSSFIQLVRSENLIGLKTRYELFIGFLKEFLPLEDIVIPLNTYDYSIDQYINLTDQIFLGNMEDKLSVCSKIDHLGEVKIRYEPKRQLYPMSSGQLSFFKFALLACLHIENGSFILLDEPETHLHPSFISGFVALLDSILEGTGSYGIIATHSPYFVREVAREQVHVFKKTNDGAIHISHPRLKTFGANIGDISYFVFDEEITNSLSQKILDKAKSESLSFEDIVRLSNSELPAEMLQEIKRKLS